MAEANDAFDIGRYRMLRHNHWAKTAWTKYSAIRSLYKQVQC
jgi:hypothetical protein